MHRPSISKINIHFQKEKQSLQMIRTSARRKRCTDATAASAFFAACVHLFVLELPIAYYTQVESLTTTTSFLQYSTFRSKLRFIPSKLRSSPSDGSDEQFTYYSPNKPLNVDIDSDNPLDDITYNIDDGSSAANEYSFFDEAIITVRAGSGGQGSSTYKKGTGGQDGIADGGNGGRGGNVILITDTSLNTLARLSNAWRPNSFGGSGAAASPKAAAASISGDAISRSYSTKHFRAENGGNGERMYNNGRYGNDVVVRVPPGTVVQEQILDIETGEVLDLVDLGILGLTQKSDEDDIQNEAKSINTNSISTLIVARGGEGGEGSAAAGKRRGAKRARLPPQSGERKTLKLTLKIVADVALVGVPNAGKSTFLAAVTRAKPKIANYPFTTIIPNLGVWLPSFYDHNEYSRQDKGAGSEGLVLCDVPGLVAGAASGVGLGHAFLRHVERCHVIVHLVDATSNDPVADYKMLNKEIQKYGTGQLATMPQVVVINKIDAFEASTGSNDWEKGLRVRCSRDEIEMQLRDVMPHTRLMWMSAKEREGVDELMLRLASFVKKVKDAKAENVQLS